ncbi:filamin-A [Nephila pilipes]|uniref:Filamin-A n=1 Tax=Nephila pilipes TaxID=299642 RepID=A0A8X6NKD3_NEPPI|nr:filamin-A [Nephila pilipes]
MELKEYLSNHTVQFIVDTKGVDMGEVLATVIGPNQLLLKSFIHGNYHCEYRVEYTLVDVGDHVVDIRIYGQPVALCPYLVKVTDIESGVIGSLFISALMPIKLVLEILKILYQLVVEMFQTICSLIEMLDSELTSNLLKHKLTLLVSNLMENLFQICTSNVP